MKQEALIPKAIRLNLERIEKSWIEEEEMNLEIKPMHLLFPEGVNDAERRYLNLQISAYLSTLQAGCQRPTVLEVLDKEQWSAIEFMCFRIAAEIWDAFLGAMDEKQRLWYYRSIIDPELNMDSAMEN